MFKYTIVWSRTGVAIVHVCLEPAGAFQAIWVLTGHVHMTSARFLVAFGAPGQAIFDAKVKVSMN